MPCAVGRGNVRTEQGMGTHVREKFHVPALEAGVLAIKGWDREVFTLVGVHECLKHGRLWGVRDGQRLGGLLGIRLG